MTPEGTRRIAWAEAPGGKPVLRAYQDTKGIWTIGFGRNLQVLRITAQTAWDQLREDIAAAEALARGLPSWPHLDTDARRDAFIELVFNMGPGHFDGVGTDDFKDTMAAIAAHDWKTARDELLDSAWAHEVGMARSLRIANTFLTGTY